MDGVGYGVGIRGQLQEAGNFNIVWAIHPFRRSLTPVPVVAIVGYTNAGKSTLLNTLTQASLPSLWFSESIFSDTRASILHLFGQSDELPLSFPPYDACPP